MPPPPTLPARLPPAVPTPTASGVVVLVATGAVALLGPGGGLRDLLLAGLLGLLATAFLLAWRGGLEQVEVTRRLPARGTKGEALVLVHQVRNRGRRGVRQLRLTERVIGEAPPAWSHGSSTFFPLLRPAARGEARTRLFLGRRGRLRLEGIAVAHSDPFGLFGSERLLPLPAEVIVGPRPRGVAGLAALVRSARRSPEGCAAEWDRVREWQAGDPLRLVHWRLTARRGFPIVRVPPDARGQETLLILDRRLPERPRRPVELEKAISLCAGIGLAVLAEGGALTFLAPGEEEPLRLRRLRGRAGRGALLEALALIQPDAAGLRALPPGIATQQAVLVTGRAPAPAERRRMGLVLEARRLLPGEAMVELPHLVAGAA